MLLKQQHSRAAGAETEQHPGVRIASRIRDLPRGKPRKWHLRSKYCCNIANNI